MVTLSYRCEAVVGLPQMVVLYLCYQMLKEHWNVRIMNPLRFLALSRPSFENPRGILLSK